MERIGLLGGTFNPIHMGHIHLAREFIEKLSLSRVIFIPAKSPPHKQGESFVSAQARYEMCRIAVRNNPAMEVSDIEIRREGVSYTADTLKSLSGMFTDTQLFLLTGADMFLTLENWRNFSEIARLADLCTAARGDSGETELNAYAKKLRDIYGARCHIVNIPVLNVSSTAIRSMIAGSYDASALLPDGVNDYIIANRLYI